MNICSILNVTDFLFRMIEELLKHSRISICSNSKTPSITLRTSACSSEPSKLFLPVVIIRCPI